MIKVGITGGIGSGKSVVARLFEILGVPVYYADDAAKRIMNSSGIIRSSLVKQFGEETYSGNLLNRAWLAAKVFNSPEQLQVLNSIVHPVVIGDAAAWIEQQKAAIVMKEAAIFFESGSYTEMDYMIGVYAPKELRIQRVMSRDGADAAAVENRISHQMNEEEKMKRCDFVLHNDEAQMLIPQVISLHRELTRLADL